MAQAVVSNISYKGYDIDFNVYGQNEYTVWFEGDDIYFLASSEKKTGAMATVAMAATEAESAVQSFDTAALTGSATGYALGIRHLKHVLAHKAGKAVDLLHRDRLLEKVHGLYLPDAENLAEFMAVLRIVVKGLDERVTLQLLAERAHIAADSREALGD